MEGLTLKGFIARKLVEEARRHGLSPEGYVLEMLTQNLDPRERAREYAEAAWELLEEAREELGRGNLRQATEKTWGAAALAVKAYAYWREGKRLASHGELWSYKSVMASELGEWVRDAWGSAVHMHVCFYEGWCDKGDVGRAVKEVRRLVEEVRKKVYSRGL